ncbi:polysaccharide deacetylase family protein [Sporosarcina trichiuri]|uniref:polysaccharide deacetylase family protein n=1 Tax=Sporosarcina trichiuri TaxID=3056445 RepID=UPI0025B52EC8|nr:polysaccharide deacetylase family protein [Sporosarcina sp. 0.2-SM1T-5]WJY26268.1 polysaccharide deacetylase family protein [Sporosarcina sp. 0.2-SM1T-5]
MGRKCWRIAAILTVIYGFYTAGATLVMRLTGTGIRKKAAARRGIALTFDDGPNAKYTPQLLALLSHYRIKAVFFVTGRHAEQHPELLRRMHAEGHAIGIHHYDHHSLWRLPPRQARREIRRTAAVIERITGSRPRFYRPPYGRLTAALPNIAKPYETILWTHILGDWKTAMCDSKLLQRLRDVPDDGSIVVLHDDGSNSGADDEAPGHMLRVLREYLQESAERGIVFLPPDCIADCDEDGP